MEAGRVVTDAPQGRVRRQRSLRELLGSIVLGFELLVVFLGALVLFGLHSLPAWLALGGGAALIVLMIIAIGLLRNTAGVVLGWIVQLVVVAAGILVPAFFIVGAIFTAMWAYCMIAAARIDRNNRAAASAADNGTENP
ncbi:DUF4233 domain-containing protein [Leifsonia shinshuensis]|uniref:DUF4233 domain-containing protein n=1 Tax=Leifsonia shinshuensis TaxID=150026 RepID=UPI0028546D98|nr:DUF4233 domain-containing protein [Leifsonia shinshuensis]MDR6970363.1 magnesium-transporting ATPase (P-type) [Leifsonia shinshuensis]